MTERKVFVTQPYLPPIEEFFPYLERIWDNKVLTNGGPFHHQLECDLAEYLGVNELALFSNGTLALITALQSLGITGDVITTPFSFVATSHALLWNGIKPIFADIDPQTLNIDPAKIERAITPQTTAIVAVHCYGHPCDVAAIQGIADRYNLRVIYDAAHAFGVQDAGGSILRHGDMSILSLHATKVFNTFEGGALVLPDVKTKAHINKLKNFGFADETDVVAAGINGKMSEFNAALGLLQLKYIDNAIARRFEVDRRYREGLAGVKGIHVVGMSGETVPNFAYFPIIVGSEYPISRDNLVESLRKCGILARRYFYPLISEFSMYRKLPTSDPSNLPVATRVSRQILCLPIYPDLNLDTVDEIINLIASVK